MAKRADPPLRIDLPFEEAVKRILRAGPATPRKKEKRPAKKRAVKNR